MSKTETSVDSSIYINAPIDEVYKYATNPVTMPQWYMNMSNVVLEKGAGEEGSIYDFDFKMLGWKVPMKLEVVENHLDKDEATYHCAFIGSGSSDVDSTEGEETWSYHTKGDGTELKFHHKDVASGKLAALIFDKAFKNTVNHALENLKDICESHTEI